MNSVDDISSELFFQMNDGGRRGHDKKLFKKRFGLDVRKYVSSNKVIDIWNSLPAHCENCCTTNIFKKYVSRTGIGNCKVKVRYVVDVIWRKPVLTHAILTIDGFGEFSE